LVGFGDDPSLSNAMTGIEDLIINRFGGSSKKYLVDINNRYIDF
jgi:hypothetical protein